MPAHSLIGPLQQRPEGQGEDGRGDCGVQEVELEEAIQQVGIHLFLVSQELSLVMVLLANMLNSIARQVNTTTCVIAREFSMT